MNSWCWWARAWCSSRGRQMSALQLWCLLLLSCPLVYPYQYYTYVNSKVTASKLHTTISEEHLENFRYFYVLLIYTQRPINCAQLRKKWKKTTTKHSCVSGLLVYAMQPLFILKARKLISNTNSLPCQHADININHFFHNDSVLIFVNKLKTDQNIMSDFDPVNVKSQNQKVYNSSWSGYASL